jgi:hypothetical protein
VVDIDSVTCVAQRAAPSAEAADPKAKTPQRKAQVLYAHEPERCLQHANYFAMAMRCADPAAFSDTPQRLVDAALTSAVLEACTFLQEARRPAALSALRCESARPAVGNVAG